MTACRWLVDRPLNGDLTRKYDFETQRMGIEWTNHDWLMIDLWLWGGSMLPDLWESVRKNMMGTCIKQV